MMESMEYAAAPAAAGELAQHTDGDTYPMMPPAGEPLPSEQQFCQLANFEIEKKIGRGQFSTVYRARCRSNGTIVALKKVQVGSCRRFSAVISTDFVQQMTVQP